jgi:ribulose-5-phosphate 4-epimerase/fuculose-1-phosphate aldolase
MKLSKERKKILEISDKLIAAGVIHNGQGNISIYDRDSGLAAITPSAVPYEERKPEDICVVDLNGKQLEGERKPTSETPLHLIYYKRRPDILAVIHTHAPKATVFGVIGKESMPMILNEAAMGIGGAVPIAPYARPGSVELAEVTCEAVGNGFAAIMAHHGLITVGTTIDLALSATLAVESTADTIIMARSMGIEPIALDHEEVELLREMFLEYKPRKA